MMLIKKTNCSISPKNVIIGKIKFDSNTQFPFLERLSNKIFSHSLPTRPIDKLHNHNFVRPVCYHIHIGPHCSTTFTMPSPTAKDQSFQIPARFQQTALKIFFRGLKAPDVVLLPFAGIVTNM